MAAPAGAVSAVQARSGTWLPCADVAAVECASLEVPIDTSDPATPTIELAVRRVRASADEGRIGVLVTIAGGPGQRGTDWVFPGLHTAAIHERFDVVSWDPRGTAGASLIDCIPDWDPFTGLDRSPDDAAERGLLDARTVVLAERCRSAHGEILPFVGTVEAAHDLERLRRMLGEEHLSILGTSYGSKVALTYATLFPGHVRAIVLDGYSDPNLSPGELQVEQASAFEHELNAMLADCANDATCAFHGDGTPGAALDQLLEELDTSPIPADGQDGWLEQSDAHEAIAGALVMGEPARLQLLQALAAAVAGDGVPLLRIANDIRHDYASSGLTMGAFAAIDCADTGDYWNTLTGAEVATLTARVHEAAPRLGPWLWSPSQDPALPPLGLCAMQPSSAGHDIGPIDAAGAGPVLVLTTTGDPTTPASGAARSTSDLEDAVVLALEANHHLAYHVALSRPDRPGYACLLEAVDTYLIDLERPRHDHDCER
jgi:pimeloyl-ACP methyl ester carboxylesterase